MLFEKIKSMNSEEIKELVKNNRSVLYDMIEQKNRDYEIWNKIILATEFKVLNNFHPKLMHPLLHHAMKKHEYDTALFLLDYSTQISHLNGDNLYNYHFLTEIDKDTDIIAYKKIYQKFQEIYQVDIKTIISDVGDNLLSNAILNNNYEIVKFYKELGIDPSQETQHKNALFALVDTHQINNLADETYKKFIEDTIQLFKEDDVKREEINTDGMNFFEVAWEDNPILVHYVLKYKLDVFREQMTAIENKLEKNKRMTYSYLPRQSLDVIEFFSDKINWEFSFGSSQENLLDFFAIGFYSNPEIFSFFVKNMSEQFNDKLYQENLMLKFMENKKEYNKESMEKYIIPEFKLIIEDPDLLRKIITQCQNKDNRDLIEALEFVLTNSEKKSLTKIFDSGNHQFKENVRLNRI